MPRADVNIVPMILYCPLCKEQHIDRPRAEIAWDNPPHKTHQCQYCGTEWRPFEYYTIGIGPSTCSYCGYGHDPEKDCVPKLRAELHAARELAWRGWYIAEAQTDQIKWIMSQLRGETIEHLN